MKVMYSYIDLFKVLIVHNSDEIKACFIGTTDEELVTKIMSSEYQEDINNRLRDELDDDEHDFIVNMEAITSLYHDGDSEDGYTLLETS
jgi:hypothetical protein